MGTIKRMFAPEILAEVALIAIVAGALCPIAGGLLGLPSAALAAHAFVGAFGYWLGRVEGGNEP